MLFTFVPSVERIAGRSVIAAITETSGISRPPIPIERMNGSGRKTMREEADGDRRARHDHRPPGVGHRLDHRRLRVGPVAQLVAEAEDHQQRVVDRHAEPDECDQVLDDDRHVSDVGEQVDEREGVQDRRDAIAIGISTAGIVPNTKSRITSAPSPPISDSVRTLGPLVLAEAKTSGSRPVRYDCHTGGRGRLEPGADLLDVEVRGEVLVPGRVDRREGRVAVLGDVRTVAGRPERATCASGAGATARSRRPSGGPRPS